MNRPLLALVPWMVLATVAQGQTRFADVLFTHHRDAPARGYRVGDECFVPLETVKGWGWAFRKNGEGVQLQGEGREFWIPTRSIQGKISVPMRSVVEQLGGVWNWLEGSDTFEVSASLESVSYRNGRLEIQSPLSVRATASVLTGPNRLMIDIRGANLSTSTRLELDPGVTVQQFGPSAVRIVAETPFIPTLPGNLPAVDRKVLLDAKPLAPGNFHEFEEPGENAEPPAPPPTYVAGGKIQLRKVSEGERSVRLSIPWPGASGVSFSRPDPAVLEVTIPGAGSDVPESPVEAITSVTTRAGGVGTVLVLGLARPMGGRVWTDASGIQIELVRPGAGDGRLAGKIVVVDPGHGGRDSGAHRASVREKDLALAVGKLLGQELAERGVTVIMTRSSDVFIPLGERSAIANRSQADFFVSVHFNSNARDESKSGTMVFHHKGESEGQLLADCLSAELAKVTGLPKLGTWSDGKIYQSGFAVLRNSNMTGVLIELGFVNHSRDRARIVDSDFQAAAARAIVQGLRRYLGDKNE